MTAVRVLPRRPVTAYRVVAGALGALPILVTLLARLEWSPAIVDAVDAWFAMHCHRAPHRTLALFGSSLPVCARCFGIYTGVLLGAALTRPRRADGSLRAATAAGFALLAVDVATEALGWRVPSLTTRWATGTAFAYPAAVASILALSDGTPGAAATCWRARLWPQARYRSRME